MAYHHFITSTSGGNHGQNDAGMVGGASNPFVGGLIRTLGEQEREQERAANRATGVFVTFAAREGSRYTARAHVVAIISAGDVALERQ